ncbi:MAG: hypothetical protein H6652_07740 [Ardenticatenaceae bacterium]|nr:hypothetical protein [Ardenticatenaceae bacterium]
MTGVVKVASAHKVEPFVGTPRHAISSELLAAQQRLLQLRAQLHESRSDTEKQQISLFDAGKLEQRPFPEQTPISQLPPHLGWESTAVTKTVRRSNPQQEQIIATAVSTKTAVSDSPTLPQTIKLYPDVAIGLLRQEQVAAGRLWLLLQAVDTTGCGWVDEHRARQLFTSKRGKLRFCGTRQLRNLLAQGETTFWERQNGRIWLRSVAKVAFALEITRLKMRPVALPVAVLRQKIGTVRAHLYATFHSSRTEADRSKKPIARTTVARLTDVNPRTQRRYERKAKVKRQAQFAIGPQATTDNLQARGWEQGQATFQFKDFNGQQGPQGKSYVAWQLPNSYVGPHAPQPKGRQKRINQTLTDLFMQGITGNDQRLSVTRRFFDNGRLAAKSYLRNPENDHYWRGNGNGRYQLWQVMERCNL